MEQVNVIEPPFDHYYLSYHCILTPDSSSTKLRVVFDWSARTTSGIELIAIMIVGSIVQNEMFANLLRFREPSFAIWRPLKCTSIFVCTQMINVSIIIFGASVKMIQSKLTVSKQWPAIPQMLHIYLHDVCSNLLLIFKKQLLVPVIQ